MHKNRFALPLGMAAFVSVWAVALVAQQVHIVEPPHESGQSVTAAFEGWFHNADGTSSILFGYYNRNTAQELDIPIGPENSIEPGGPDQGQPTHFLVGRQWGVFTVTVPQDFGSKKITWTITANGMTTQVPGDLATLWELNPFKDANGNTPPWIGFEPTGPFVNGPKGQAKSITGSVGNPVPLTAWVADDASVIPGATQPRTPAVTVSWSKFRGAGEVKFASDRPAAEPAEFTTPAKTQFHAKTSTTATFSTPGDYVLRLQANDWSGEGGRGFQCCWSNAEVKVSVK